MTHPSTDAQTVRELLRSVSRLKAGTPKTGFDGAWLALDRIETEIAELREEVKYQAERANEIDRDREQMRGLLDEAREDARRARVHAGENPA